MGTYTRLVTRMKQLLHVSSSHHPSVGRQMAKITRSARLHQSCDGKGTANHLSSRMVNDELTLSDLSWDDESGVTRSNDIHLYTRDVSKLISEYWDEVENLPPYSQVKPGYLVNQLPLRAPQKPDEWNDVISDVRKLIFPGLTHWSSPHFNGYVELGTSAAGTAADQLTAAINQVTFAWTSSPAGTELEMQMTDWLGRMMDLPDEFLFSSGKGNGGGVIQESASMCCLLMLLAAKRRVVNELQRDDPNLDPFDVTPKLVAFTSDQAHSCMERAGIIAGIRFEILETDRHGALRGETLKKAIQQTRTKGMIPTFVGATLGSTTSSAFDNLMELGPVCRDEGVWLHVDAASAGTAFICPEFRPLMNGVEYSDSFNCGPHKSMLVPMSCAVMWVRDRALVESSLHITPPYMNYQRPDNLPDYRHWSLNLTRPFRAMKLWFVMRLYGVEGLQDHVRKQAQLLQDFADLMSIDDRFEICAEVVMTVVCFRLKDFDDDVNIKLLNRINEAGKVYLISSVLKGRIVLRFAPSSSTEEQHVRFAWQEIQTAANEMLREEEKRYV